MTILAVFLFIIAAWFIIGVVGTVASIGKPRKPLEGGMAAFTVLISFFFIVVIVIAGIQLLGVS